MLRIGHRGAAALEPENTLASLARAVELGVDFVEFDVLDLADGTLVLAHSDDLLEVSHGAAGGRGRPLRLAELRAVVPDLPTLEQALELFAANGAGLHVDVKCLRHGREVGAALRRHGLLDRAVASSHWSPTLRDLRTEEPELAVGITYPEDRRGLARRRLLTPLVPTAVGMLASAVLLPAAAASGAPAHSVVELRTAWG